MEWIKNIIANCTYHMQNRKEYLDWTTLHGISKLTELVNKALDAGHTGVWSYDDLNIMTMNGNKQPRYDVLARLDELRQYGWVQPKHVAKNEFKQNIKFKTREYNHLMDMLKYTNWNYQHGVFLIHLLDQTMEISSEHQCHSIVLVQC